MHEVRQDGLPTQMEERGWIHVFSERDTYPEAHETRSGKWLIWLSPSVIDCFWIRIREAVKQGRLGDEAKVLTAGSAKGRDHVSYVICVYTYDYEDTQDVMRIREELRRIGIRLPITYKADEDTRQLRYGKDYTPKYRA